MKNAIEAGELCCDWCDSDAEVRPVQLMIGWGKGFKGFRAEVLSLCKGCRFSIMGHFRYVDKRIPL